MEPADLPKSLADRLNAIEAEQAKLTETILSLVATVRRFAPETPGLSALRPLAEAHAGEVPGGGPGDSQELVAWVRWLTDRYELGATLPACWPRHGELVEELAALWVGWRDTIGAGQGGTAALQWHDYLGRALDRIERRWRVCTDGTHRTREPADWLAEGPDGADELDLTATRFRPS